MAAILDNHQEKPILDWSSGALAEGLQCYRTQEFFQAHEHWEIIWLESREPEKTFLQALIQIAAAFHHLQRGNIRGTSSLLRAALRRLEPYPDYFQGIFMMDLRDEIRACLQMLEIGGPLSAVLSVPACNISPAMRGPAPPA